MCSDLSFTGASFFASPSIFDLPWGSSLGLFLIFHPQQSSWLISSIQSVVLAASSTRKTCLRHLKLSLSPVEAVIFPIYPIFPFCLFPSQLAVSSFAKLSMLETSELSLTLPSSPFHLFSCPYNDSTIYPFPLRHSEESRA